MRYLQKYSKTERFLPSVEMTKKALNHFIARSEATWQSQTCIIWQVPLHPGK